MRWLARTCVVFCALWVLSFPLFGGSSAGKSIFSAWSAVLFPDDIKAGVPTLMLTIPILLAGSVASLFGSASNGRLLQFQFHFLGKHSKCPGSARYGFWSWGRSMTLFLFLFLLVLACSIYVLSSIHRHLSGEDLTTSKKLGYIGNSFGMMAVVVLSWLLLPVSRLGPLTSLFHLDQIDWTIFHIWSGRLLLIGAVLHGLFHMSRWIHQGESVVAMNIPPMACWTNADDFQPSCHNQTTDCSCYYRFRNFTGMLATLSFLGIGLSSLERVRRQNYDLFYRLHVSISTIGILATLAHYNKAILYAAGGLLYYIATSYPAWIERLRQSPTRVVAIKQLACIGNRHCITLDIEASDAAFTQYRPGVYCYIKVPAISSVAHPFTINRVYGTTKRLRVIFRATGHWTKSLAKHLLLQQQSPKNASLACRCFVTGYYGSTVRVEQALRHDAVLIVAAGIGITPYLSLLLELAGNAAESSLDRRIVVHWICRDLELIEYCRLEYFSKLSVHGSGVKIRIIVHQTETEHSNGNRGAPHDHYADNPEQGDQTSQYIQSSLEGDETRLESPGTPFRPTAFSVRDTLWENFRLCVLFSATVATEFLLIWYGYHNLQDKHEIQGRVYVGVMVALVGIIAAISANLISYQISRRFNQQVNFDIISNSEDLDPCTDHNADLAGSIVEMTSPTASRTVVAVHPTGTEDCQNASPSLVQKRVGRPTVKEFVPYIQECCCPAVFYCVPYDLGRELRNTIEMDVPDAVFYKESFHI